MKKNAPFLRNDGVRSCSMCFLQALNLDINIKLIFLRLHLKIQAYNDR